MHSFNIDAISVIVEKLSPITHAGIEFTNGDTTDGVMRHTPSGCTSYVFCVDEENDGKLFSALSTKKWKWGRNVNSAQCHFTALLEEFFGIPAKKMSFSKGSGNKFVVPFSNTMSIREIYQKAEQFFKTVCNASNIIDKHLFYVTLSDETNHTLVYTTPREFFEDERVFYNEYADEDVVNILAQHGFYQQDNSVFRGNLSPKTITKLLLTNPIFACDYYHDDMCAEFSDFMSDYIFEHEDEEEFEDDDF